MAAKAVAGLSLLAAFQSDSAAASEAGRRALQVSTGVGTPWLIAQSLLVLGYSYWRSYPDQAKTILEKSVIAADESQNPWLQAVTRVTLGSHDLSYGRNERAKVTLMEGLERARVLADNWLIAEVLGHLGWLAAIDNQPDSAREFLEECIALYQPLRDPRSLAYRYSCLGAVCIQTGQLEQAGECFKNGIRLSREVGDIYHAALYCVISAIAHKRGILERAVQLLAASSSLPRDSIVLGDCWHLDDHETALRDLLGAERFDSEWNKGLAFDQSRIAAAIADVLNA
jgi:tetratricopeptide (TPR) repeat protein